MPIHFSLVCPDCGKPLRTVPSVSFAEMRRAKIALVEQHKRIEPCRQAVLSNDLSKEK